MRNLTELLQEIPLDEMTGDVDMTDKELNRITEDTENKIAQDKREEISPARVKTKAPKIIAAAVCAVLVGAGIFASGIIKVEEDDSVSPAAEQSAAEQSSASEEVSAADTGVLTENTQYMEKTYSAWGRDFSYIADKATIFDKEIGTIESGFENLEIRVIGTVCTYPYYNIYVMVRTLDGSPISDGSYLSFDNGMLSLSQDKGTLNAYYYGGLDVYGDYAIGTIRINYEDNDNSFESDSTAVLSFSELSDDSSASYTGTFTAQIPMGEMIYSDKSAEVNKSGTWSSDGDYTLEYEVKDVTYSNGGLALTMDITSEDTDIVTYSTYSVSINPVLRSVKRWTDPEHWEENGVDPNADYDFVKVKYADGTETALDFSDFDLIRDDATGYFKAYFSLTSSPIDSESVTGFSFGSVDVEL